MNTKDIAQATKIARLKASSLVLHSWGLPRKETSRQIVIKAPKTQKG